MSNISLRIAALMLTIAAAAFAIVETATHRVGGGAALAQNAPHIEKADKLLGIIFESGLVEQTLEAFNPLLITQVEAAAESEGVKLDEAARSRLIEIATQETVWMYEDMRPELAQLYAQTFSEKELDTLLELYSSEEGIAIMQKLPVLTAGMSQMLTARLPAMQDRVQRRITSEVFPMLK